MGPPASGTPIETNSCPSNAVAWSGALVSHGNRPRAKEKHQVEVYQRSEHTTAQIAELFSVASSHALPGNPARRTTPPQKCSLRKRVRIVRAPCVEEYQKTSVHTRLHNPEKTGSVVQTTSENDTESDSSVSMTVGFSSGHVPPSIESLMSEAPACHKSTSWRGKHAPAVVMLHFRNWPHNLDYGGIDELR